MTRLAALVLGVAVACGACANGSSPSTTAPAGSDIRFTITFTFDSHAANPDFWAAGSFTTTGTLSRAVIARLGQARGEIGYTWPSSGKQQFGDFACTTPDQCLQPCLGKYDATWQDTPKLGVVERSGGHVVLDALLSADPRANDDQFLKTPGCPPSVGSGWDEFPPMLITIDGLDGPTLTFSVKPIRDDGAATLAPGETFKLAIAPLP